MTTKIESTVKYSEIDSMGIVHHTRYPKWFEAGRNDFLKNAGLPSGTLNALGLYLPLTEMNCKYKSPARFGDEITIITSLIHASCVKLKFGYTIINKSSGKILATGITTHAWTNKALKPFNIEKADPEIYIWIKKLEEAPSQ